MGPGGEHLMEMMGATDCLYNSISRELGEKKEALFPCLRQLSTCTMIEQATMQLTMLRAYASPDPYLSCA